jgi:hypothetical protein
MRQTIDCVTALLSKHTSLQYDKLAVEHTKRITYLDCTLLCIIYFIHSYYCSYLNILLNVFHFRFLQKMTWVKEFHRIIS